MSSPLVDGDRVVVAVIADNPFAPRVCCSASIGTRARFCGNTTTTSGCCPSIPVPVWPMAGCTSARGCTLITCASSAV